MKTKKYLLLIPLLLIVFCNPSHALKLDDNPKDGYVDEEDGGTGIGDINAGTDLSADLEEETHASEHTIGGSDIIDRLTEGTTETTIVTTGAGTDTDGIVVSKGVYNTNGLTITFDNFVDGVDGDESSFAEGDWFILYMSAATAVLDCSDNSDMECNANTDFAGSTSQVVPVLFVYRGTVWTSPTLIMGFSDPSTFPVKLGHTTVVDADGGTLTEAQMYNTTWMATGAGTITMYGATFGPKMNFCVENHTDGDVLIDPNGTDAIKLNGATQLTDGYMIIGTDTGDGCCFSYYEAGVISAWCKGYEDNGS